MGDNFYFGGASTSSSAREGTSKTNPFMQQSRQQNSSSSFIPPFQQAQPSLSPQQQQQQFFTQQAHQPQPQYFNQQQQFYNPQQQQQQLQQQQFYNPQQQQPQQQFYNPQQQQQQQPLPPQHIITWRGMISSFIPTSDKEGDKPLLEELDVNLNHIRRKTIAVLNPLSIMKPLDEDLMTDGDLAGPFIFCFLLGMSLLVLNGRVHFGFIYGLGLLGWACIWFILNAMSESSQIPTIRCASILGYCILPMVLLSLTSIILPLKGGLLGLIAGATTVGWSTLASSNMFVSSLKMKDQRILVAYPVGFFYFSFALMTIF